MRTVKRARADCDYAWLAAKMACLIIAALLLQPFLQALATGAAVQAPGGQALEANALNSSIENDSYTIGVQAYIYGLAPVIMQRTEELFTTTPGPGHAPVNQFGCVTELATPTNSIIVSPNADTLYSSAWLELGPEPVILHVPDTGGRYYVMQLLDAYTNTFNSVGRRTTGTGEGNYAIVGPDWNGSLPAGVSEIRSPTDTVWIVGRILVNGYDDLSNATALQSQFTLTPVSRLGSSPAPAQNQTLADFKRYAPAPDAQEELAFFEDLRVALLNNPPPKDEAALMSLFGNIGLRQTTTPYGSDLDPAIVRGLTRALKDGQQIGTEAWTNAPAKKINGWTFMTNIGKYGTDYLTRAAVAEGGLGANLPEEAVYPKAQTDSDGTPLNGGSRYVMHFANGNLPPVDAFWSLTAYNASTYMLVPNPIFRYAIGDRTQGLQYNPDGSLDIYIQADAPEGKESNWLPAPEGNFYLILRMYQPKPDVLGGTYQIPPVRKVS